MFVVDCNRFKHTTDGNGNYDNVCIVILPDHEFQTTSYTYLANLETVAGDCWWKYDVASPPSVILTFFYRDNVFDPAICDSRYQAQFSTVCPTNSVSVRSTYVARDCSL